MLNTSRDMYHVLAPGEKLNPSAKYVLVNGRDIAAVEEGKMQPDQIRVTELGADRSDLERIAGFANDTCMDFELERDLAEAPTYAQRKEAGEL